MRIRHTAATAAATMLLALTTACTSSSDNGDTAKPAAPKYEITHQDDTGNQREVVVEVETTKNLEAVFEDVAGKLDDEAGYFVLINCTSGGAKAADNRLANGRVAVGKMGAASTGMNEGDREFEPVKGATCP
ncbi:hypothetical protein ACLIYP_05545 [Streptomyces nanhaiensis]|uniref:hypothetical protein n=1 Tax=Streptomyces nanhaiensis TaxID=679319 RepID=UPI00399C75E7